MHSHLVYFCFWLFVVVSDDFPFYKKRNTELHVCDGFVVVAFLLLLSRHGCCTLVSVIFSPSFALSPSTRLYLLLEVCACAFLAITKTRISKDPSVAFVIEHLDNYCLSKGSSSQACATEHDFFLVDLFVCDCFCTKVWENRQLLHCICHTVNSMHDSTLLMHTDKYIFEEQNYVLFGKTKDQSRRDSKRIDIFREKMLLDHHNKLTLIELRDANTNNNQSHTSQFSTVKCVCDR